MTEADVRDRIAKLARSLRQFGLVDKFGLGDLVCDPELPPVEVFAARLRRNSESLPRGISVTDVALVLRRDLVADEPAEATNVELAGLTAELGRISPGDAGASAYHDVAIALLGRLFKRELALESKETPLHGGRKRIDMVYRNLGVGFFGGLEPTHGIRCPYVPVECKNYVADPKNPELDQLSGRLNRAVGQFGVLVCRTISDRSEMLARCAGYKTKQSPEYLLVLTDDDLVAMAAARKSGSAMATMDRRLRELLFA